MTPKQPTALPTAEAGLLTALADQYAFISTTLRTAAQLVAEYPIPTPQPMRDTGLIAPAPTFAEETIQAVKRSPARQTATQKIKAGRRRSAALLRHFSTTEPRPAGRLRQGLGVLKRHGYITRTAAGLWLRTNQPYVP